MIAHASPTRPTTRVRDVVCAMPIHLVEEALLHREHWHGRAFFFCSTVCRDEFRRAPERYVPGSISATTGISDTPDARLIWLPLLGATDADGERIESALRSLAGVEGVHANAGCGLVTVLYDPTAVTADVFIETLQVVGVQAAVVSVRLRIRGMYCPSCVVSIERELERTPGVHVATVNRLADEATVLYEPAKVSVSVLHAAVERAGYAVPTAADAGTAEHDGAQTPQCHGLTPQAPPWPATL